MSIYSWETFDSEDHMNYEKSHRILQSVWDWVKDGNEDILRSAAFPPMLSVIEYFVMGVLYLLLDVVIQNYPKTFIKSWKIREERWMTWPVLKNALMNTFWNHALFILPLAWSQVIWTPPTPLPPVAPTLLEFVWQIIASFVLFDFYYYIFHIFCHNNRVMYRWIHSVHHQYYAPFALATNYVHPSELMYIGIGVTVAPWPFKPHIFTYFCWILVAMGVSVEAHSGFDLPWSPHHYIPFFGGSRDHDMHHRRPLTNYQPWMNHFDRLFGHYATIESIETKNKNGDNEYGHYTKDVCEDLERWN